MVTLILRNLSASGLAPELAFIATAATAAPGDVLYSKGDNVNVRAEPSMKATVILQIDRGHKLIEFDRAGDWVNVGVERTGGKDGWVHESLVTATDPGGGSSAQPDPAFDRFKDAVTLLNEKVRQRVGGVFFDRVENMGDGIVQLRATRLWLSGGRADQEGNLDTLFSLWDAAEGSGLPISVRIVDRSGRVVMRKSRR